MSTPPPRRLRLLVDVALVGWLIAWVVVGVQVGRDVRGLAELNDTVVLAGRAIEQTGELLEEVGRIPLAAVWIPLRLHWRRERLAVRRALATGAPELERLLADRARAALPPDQVIALGDDRKRLADAELERLGLGRP